MEGLKHPGHRVVLFHCPATRNWAWAGTGTFLSDRVDSRRAVLPHSADRDQPMAPVLAVFVVDFYRGLERHRHLYDVQPAAAAARRTLGRRSEAGLRGCCFSADAVSDPHRRPRHHLVGQAPVPDAREIRHCRKAPSPDRAHHGRRSGPAPAVQARRYFLVRCVRSASVRGPDPASDDGKP